jgi:hypothetical protein
LQPLDQGEGFLSLVGVDVGLVSGGLGRIAKVDTQMFYLNDDLLAHGLQSLNIGLNLSGCAFHKAYPLSDLSLSQIHGAGIYHNFVLASKTTGG